MSSNELDTRTRILNATWQLMEERRGQDVHMRDIAQAAAISRQAVYLHFATRTELMIATIQYVDEVKGLVDRMAPLQMAKDSLEQLEMGVEIWGNYIPEIYGLAKAMLKTKDTDEATAAAWDSSMRCLYDVCQATIEALEHEGLLSSQWSPQEATEMFFTMLSIHNWEQLTVDCGWSTPHYIDQMKIVLKQTFIAVSKHEE